MADEPNSPTTDNPNPAAPPPPPTPPPPGKNNTRVQRVQMQAPSVGRAVHFVDREMALHAASVNRRYVERGDPHRVDVEPFAATITRVHRTQDGAPTGTVGLCVLHPEMGAQVKLDVPFADTYTAGHWSWPPYVPAAR